MTNNGEKLLSIRDLHLTMTSFDGSAHVLNGINLDVRRGEIWGLVGESGCGKSVTGLSISRLVASPPARRLSKTRARASSSRKSKGLTR